MSDKKEACPLCKQRRKCAFCHKPRQDVKYLFTNGAVTICDECVALAVKLGDELTSSIGVDNPEPQGAG